MRSLLANGVHIHVNEESQLVGAVLMSMAHSYGAVLMRELLQVPWQLLIEHSFLLKVFQCKMHPSLEGASRLAAGGVLKVAPKVALGRAGAGSP